MGDQHKGDTDIRGQSRKQLSEGLESTRRRTDTDNWKAAYRGVRIIRRTAGAPPPLGGRITLCRALSYRLFSDGADPMSELFACLPEVPNPNGLQLELRVRGDERNPQFLSIFRICRPHPTWGYAFSTIVARKGNIQ
jgi:hypothetical protein